MVTIDPGYIGGHVSTAIHEWKAPLGCEAPNGRAGNWGVCLCAMAGKEEL